MVIAMLDVVDILGGVPASAAVFLDDLASTTAALHDDLPE
jgi:hypothetical protein